jgi:O-antigen ligase
LFPFINSNFISAALMLNNTNSKLNSRFFPMLIAWFLLLLFPLLKIFPTPSSQPAQPWQTEFIASAILLAALLWLVGKKTNFAVDRKIIVPFLLFIFWSGVSVFWANSEMSVAHHTLVWSGYLIFFFVFAAFLQNGAIRQHLFGGLAAVLSIVALLCIFDLTTMADFKANEGAFRIRYARYAELILIVAPLFWALALQIKNQRRQFYVLAVGVLLWLAVAYSLSKGALLAGAFAFVIFFAGSFLFTRKFYDRRKIAVLFFVWLIVTCASQISFVPNSEKPSTADYFSGNADQTRTTTHFRIFTWQISAQMIAENWTTGVGADNFGARFNESRERYAAENLSDERLTMAEDYFVQRAHNEFLQIFAELGFVGFSLFLLLGAAFFIYFARAFAANGFRFPPVLWACLAGLAGFFASSMVSSFSFRAMPNGIVFFFVLAFAYREAGKILTRKKIETNEFALPKAAPAFAFAAVAVFFAVSLAANASNLLVAFGEREREISAAESYFEKAVQFNSENSVAYFSHGLRYYFDKQPEKAVPLLTAAIENGFDVNIAYFYLAAAQSAAGDAAGAEKTFAKAVSIYPRSIFLRTRYALLLEKIGRGAEAAEQLEIARRFDEKQARGWFELLTTGARAAALKSHAEKSFPEPADLLPNSAVYAALDEQKIENLFPESFAFSR